MSHLYYLANMRLPTEKAHGLQIVQMCEAFTQAGYQVTLVIPDRRNQPRFQGLDPHAFYGVEPVFDIIRLWTLDLAGEGGISRRVYRLQAATYFLSTLAWLARQPRDAILYSRDPFLLWLVGLVYPRRKLVYEAHTASQTRTGRAITRRALRHAATALAVTRHLADELEQLSGRSVRVEHDGIRAERFADAPDQAEARQRLGLPADVFIACYVGQLTTMSMDKGLGTVIEAFGRGQAQRPGWKGHFLMVGGPAEAVEALRGRWIGLGLPDEAFHAAGQVAAAAVPVYLAASDACLMPQPWTQFFAYYTSPLKLFEYMAAGRPIIASDLPSFREVLTEGENALFAPPSDPDALAGALLRLSADEELQARMGQKNWDEVDHYTWRARARRIASALDGRLTRQFGADERPDKSPASR